MVISSVVIWKLKLNHFPCNRQKREIISIAAFLYNERMKLLEQSKHGTFPFTNCNHGKVVNWGRCSIKLLDGEIFGIIRGRKYCYAATVAACQSRLPFVFLALKTSSVHLIYTENTNGVLSHSDRCCVVLMQCKKSSLPKAVSFWSCRLVCR